MIERLARDRKGLFFGCRLFQQAMLDLDLASYDSGSTRRDSWTDSMWTGRRGGREPTKSITCRETLSQISLKNILFADGADTSSELAVVRAQKSRYYS